MSIFGKTFWNRLFRYANTSVQKRFSKQPSRNRFRRRDFVVVFAIDYRPGPGEGAIKRVVFTGTARGDGGAGCRARRAPPWRNDHSVGDVAPPEKTVATPFSGACRRRCLCTCRTRCERATNTRAEMSTLCERQLARSAGRGVHVYSVDEATGRNKEKKNRPILYICQTTSYGKNIRRRTLVVSDLRTNEWHAHGIRLFKGYNYTYRGHRRVGKKKTSLPFIIFFLLHNYGIESVPKK